MSAPLRVPRLTSRSAVAWLVGTVLVLLAVLGYLWVTQPANRWAAAVVLPVVLVAVLAVTGSRQWLDPGARTIAWQRFWVLRATVATSEVTGVGLVSNHAGGVLLSLRAGHRRRHLPVLLLSQYVRASQSPEICLAMAELVESTPDPGTVPDQLRAQARSIEAGAPPERSFLANRAGDRWARIAGGGGAVGGGSSLL